MSNIQIDNAKYLDIVLPMCVLIEYNNSYSKTSATLQQYCGDEPNATTTDSKSFKCEDSIQRWKSQEEVFSPVEYHGKNDQARKRFRYIDNILFFNRTLWALRW